VFFGVSFGFAVGLDSGLFVGFGAGLFSVLGAGLFAAGAADLDELLLAALGGSLAKAPGLEVVVGLVVFLAIVILDHPCHNGFRIQVSAYLCFLVNHQI
jgi:hypothetical protein